MAVLRLLFFCLLALFAQMLGIGWKSHVLQLASGLALNGAVTLLTQIALDPSAPPRVTLRHYGLNTRWNSACWTRFGSSVTCVHWPIGPGLSPVKRLQGKNLVLKWHSFWYLYLEQLKETVHHSQD